MEYVVGFSLAIGFNYFFCGSPKNAKQHADHEEDVHGQKSRLFFCDFLTVHSEKVPSSNLTVCDIENGLVEIVDFPSYKMV
jgi:hypothetical protein